MNIVSEQPHPLAVVRLINGQDFNMIGSTRWEGNGTDVVDKLTGYSRSIRNTSMIIVLRVGTES